MAPKKKKEKIVEKKEERKRILKNFLLEEERKQSKKPNFVFIIWLSDWWLIETDICQIAKLTTNTLPL